MGGALTEPKEKRERSCFFRGGGLEFILACRGGSMGIQGEGKNRDWI